MFVQIVDTWRLRPACPIPILVGFFLLLSAPGGLAQRPEEDATRVEVYRFYNPNNPTEPYTRQLIAFMRENPDVKVEQWGGISIPGGGMASLMMSIAGKTAPDVGLGWFHTIQNEIKQQFLYPLNEWIGEDTNGNGRIDDEEAIWEGWKDVPPLWRNVATVDGKVYGIPVPIDAIAAILYRTDIVKAAGLDPNTPPRTWTELEYWCRRLTEHDKVIPGAIVPSGQKGICLPTTGEFFLPWIQSAGGRAFVQKRTSPTTGATHAFPLYEDKFITPDGEDLSTQESEWECTLASPEGLQAADFLYRLRWGKWTSDPVTGEPLSLTDEQVRQGFADVDGRRIEFQADDVVTGVARMQAQQPGMRNLDLLGRGEVAMMVGSVGDLKAASSGANLDPNLLRWFPFPAAPGPKGQRVVQIYNHYGVMYNGVGDRPKAERDVIWRVLTAICSKKVVDHDVTTRVLEGLSAFIAPSELKRMGYEEYIRDIPPELRANFSDLEAGRIKGLTEPWAGFWFVIYTALDRECFGIMLGQNGEDFDYRTALKTIQHKANSGLMFETPREVLDQRRPAARLIVGLVIGLMAFLVLMIVRSHWLKRKKKDVSRSVYSGSLAWLMVFPALLLIALWRYYPLLRGMVMAFQDYKITGDARFVGLDNFILLAMDKSFWMSLLRTCYFVFLNMVLAFSAPILLAILLTEVTHCKIFFRTLFFLPQMTSGLVIALLWKLMYTPTPDGFFNQLIAYVDRIPFINIGPQTWLDDPALAMICCVIPTVWASMGMASLIYLAALHSIPNDFYEAAEVDGAGILAKIVHITIPTILPLIIINFIGTFIGTFQNMGNIFLLTFGGPGEATTVVGLKIWIEAYNNLRFSMATSMAWVLGSLLIGFTYLQIKFLSKVEYRKAQE